MNERATHFYVIRHGQSEGNVQRIIQGHADSDLSAKGEAQAAELGESLRDVSFDVAFSSDLIRARRTAEIVLRNREIAVDTTRLLREHDMGKWERRNTDEWREANKELLAAYEQMSEDDKWDARIPEDVESDRQVIERLMTFFRDTTVTHPGKTVLAATHGGVMRCLLVYLGFGTHAELPIGSVGNTGLIRIVTNGDTFEILETRGVAKRETNL